MTSINPIVHGVRQPILPPAKTESKQKTSMTFQETLKTISSAPEALTISKHAEQRLNERGIHIHENEWNLIGQKLTEAKSKGVTDSLVVLKDAALIASAKNNTIITAMNREEASTRIFTNINGTILMDY
ncbi:TIGR02530 family flagellar biosynthesis protein [Domibacillus enclensis]|uniref:Flagellar operon protein n=1 Tax=Domibacillus enclensis TaxID=1017273 RepID=A0A1N6UKR5_9BACI|nr:TIGR02530 family flagellar biosynthesis protein [Domibacillus enclensis]SIQ66204.1 flagellar operon protein [Domibacillus enclensis]